MQRRPIGGQYEKLDADQAISAVLLRLVDQRLRLAGVQNAVTDAARQHEVHAHRAGTGPADAGRLHPALVRRDVDVGVARRRRAHLVDERRAGALRLPIAVRVMAGVVGQRRCRDDRHRERKPEHGRQKP
jgi:hypothetical protein